MVDKRAFLSIMPIMDRKLASIQKIISLEPIPGADAILVAQVLGWKCVVKKEEFKVGDLCIYFEIDSILPIAQWNDHLRKGSEKDKPLRVRSIRLRGQLSQGLALPIKGILGDPIPVSDLADDMDWKIDDDVTDLTGVKKYDPPIPIELSGVMKGNFPAFIPKTDEIRLQSKPDLLNEVVGVPMVGTMKMDGSSVTAYLRDGVFGVCSRNIDLMESSTNAYWKAARAISLEEKMRGYCMLTGANDFSVQGELCGPGIQGNKMGLEKVTILFYNIYFISPAAYGSTTQLKEFCRMNGLEMVPIVFSGVLDENINNVEGMLKFASLLDYSNGTPAEGIVWRPEIEQYSKILKGRLSMKTISNRFLEKYKE